MNEKEKLSDETLESLASLTEHGREPTKLELDRFIRSLGYRWEKVKLEIIDQEEQVNCSLVSKYPFYKISDVIIEACKHQRDADLAAIRRQVEEQR